MKSRPNKSRRVVDNITRHTRSDHGTNNLYTPPIGRGSTTDVGDSALLKRLEKITNEINTMQTYPNQNHPPNQIFHSQFNPQSHFGMPSGYPPSMNNASPRPLDYHVGQESPRQRNEEAHNGYNNGHSPQQHHSQQHHSPQHHSPQKGGYSQFGTGLTGSNLMDMSDMSLNMKSLQASLAEAHLEHRRALNRVELESNERRKLEQQNFDLNNKLLDARQAVKDTQAALQSAQFATDQLTNKRNQREAYLQELSAVNTTNITRIATLEAKLKEADDGLLEGSSRRDQFIHQIQSQLGAAQEEVYAAQAEINKLNGQKCQVETELDNLRERYHTTEQRLKSSEASIELNYKAKVSVLEDKNQALLDKIAMEKHVYSQVQHLEEQLAHKSTALQRALESSKQSEVSLHEAMGQLMSRDEVLLVKEEEILQLETKLTKLESEVKKERQASSRCKVLEAELSSKQTEMKMVNQALNDAQAELEDTATKVSQLSREINDKNKDIMDIDQKLKHALKMNMSERGFNEIIASMQSEISDMESALHAERLGRKTAEEDAETFQMKIRSLESALKEKTNVIAEKTADVKNLQKIVNFDQIKSNQLLELENKVSELTHQLTVEVQSSRITKRDLEKSLLKVKSLELAVQTREKTIQDLEEAAKGHTVNQVSDRIMNSTIQQLETQLQERDGTIAVKQEKVKSLEKSLQDALGRIRQSENDLKDHASDAQGLAFQKQNAEREAIKLRGTVQSLENKLSLIEKQNETMEARTKLLIFEKHEAVNKLEMLELVVQDMAEATIDSASSVKEQERLVSELNNANLQIATLAAELEKSNMTTTSLRNSLAHSDAEVKRLSAESHSTHVAKKAANAIMNTFKDNQNNRNKAHELVMQHAAAETPAQEPSGRPDERRESYVSQSHDTPPIHPTRGTMPAALMNLEGANGITGRKHHKDSSLSEMTDLINSTSRDVEKISEKKKDMREGIEKYTADFKEKHGRVPTNEDKAAAPDNIFTNYQQLNHILKIKSAKLADLETEFAKMQEAAVAAAAAKT